MVLDPLGRHTVTLGNTKSNIGLDMIVVPFFKGIVDHVDCNAKANAHDDNPEGLGCN